MDAKIASRCAGACAWKPARIASAYVRCLLPAVLLLSVASLAPAGPSRISEVKTHGCFGTAGVIIKVDRMDFDETASIEYRRSGETAYKRGHDFVRYDGNHMATSLFGLQLNSTYELRANDVFDYNLMYSTRQTDRGVAYKWVCEYGDPLNNTRYETLTAFRAAVKQETHGNWANPRLRTNLLPGYPAISKLLDLRLKPGSPAIDAGVVIPGVNDGFSGSAPDVGADETLPGRVWRRRE